MEKFILIRDAEVLRIEAQLLADLTRDASAVGRQQTALNSKDFDGNCEEFFRAMQPAMQDAARQRVANIVRKYPWAKVSDQVALEAVSEAIVKTWQVMIKQRAGALSDGEFRIEPKYGIQGFMSRMLGFGPHRNPAGTLGSRMREQLRYTSDLTKDNEGKETSMFDIMEAKQDIPDAAPEKLVREQSEALCQALLDGKSIRRASRRAGAAFLGTVWFESKTIGVSLDRLQHLAEHIKGLSAVNPATLKSIFDKVLEKQRARTKKGRLSTLTDLTYSGAHPDMFDVAQALPGAAQIYEEPHIVSKLFENKIRPVAKEISDQI